MYQFARGNETFTRDLWEKAAGIEISREQNTRCLRKEPFSSSSDSPFSASCFPSLRSARRSVVASREFLVPAPTDPGRARRRYGAMRDDVLLIEAHRLL